jgi:hypothetical protein
MVAVYYSTLSHSVLYETDCITAISIIRNVMPKYYIFSCDNCMKYIAVINQKLSTEWKFPILYWLMFVVTVKCLEYCLIFIITFNIMRENKNGS